MLHNTNFAVVWFHIPLSAAAPPFVALRTTIMSLFISKSNISGAVCKETKCKFATETEVRALS